MEPPIFPNYLPKYVRDMRREDLEIRRKAARFGFHVHRGDTCSEYVPSQGLVAGLFCHPPSASVLEQATQDALSTPDFVSRLLRHMDWKSQHYSPWISGSDSFLWALQEAWQRVWSDDTKVEVVIFDLERISAAADTTYNTIYYAEELLALPVVQKQCHSQDQLNLYRQYSNAATELLFYHRVPEAAIVARVPIEHEPLRTLLAQPPFEFLDTVGGKHAIAGQRTEPDPSRSVAPRHALRTPFKNILSWLHERVRLGCLSLPLVALGAYLAELAIVCLYTSWTAGPSRTQETTDTTRHLALIFMNQLYSINETQAAQIQFGIERRLGHLDAYLQDFGKWIPVEATIAQLTRGLRLPDQIRERVAQVLSTWEQDDEAAVPSSPEAPASVTADPPNSLTATTTPVEDRCIATAAVLLAGKGRGAALNLGQRLYNLYGLHVCR